MVGVGGFWKDEVGKRLQICGQPGLQSPHEVVLHSETLKKEYLQAERKCSLEFSVFFPLYKLYYMKLLEIFPPRAFCGNFGGKQFK